MLNPTQLKLHNFQLLENGCYSPREVDNFFRQVTEDYSAMFTENGELVRKLGILAAKLEEYRKDESVLRDVLMNAQKNAELLIASAQQRANEMIEDANAQVQRIMKDGETIIDSANDKAHKISIAAEAEYESLIASAKVLAESYIITANEKCDEIKNQTKAAVEQMLKDVEEQATAVLEEAEAQAQQIRDEAAESVEEYISELRENTRAEIEAKAKAAEDLFANSQAEADRITAQAKSEADALLESVKEQTESLLTAAMAQKEAMEISSANEAEELLEESRRQADELLTASREQADELLTTSRAQADEMLAHASQLADDAGKQYDALIGEATEQAQAILDDGRNKAVAMLTEAQTVSQDAKLRSETSSQQIIARIKDQALKMLTDAKTYSDEVCEKVLTQAEQIISASKIEADRILSEAKDFADNTKKEISELSDARMSQAMDMSGSLISSAQADAQKIIATAQTRVSVAFDDVEGRVEQTLLDAENKRIEILSEAKQRAEETEKLADDNAQRMMDEAIEKAADMLMGAKIENERIVALTADMKQQIADSIAFAQAEYDALREKAMELRKKMLAQLLTEEEQAEETARRNIRDIPEFNAEEMLRDGMRRAKESAAEIVADSKDILMQSGLYAERTIAPEPVADIEEQSVPAMVEEIQRRIDIDNQFDDLVSAPAEKPALPEFEVSTEIEDKILNNAALDVGEIVDAIVGEDGFATVDENVVDAQQQEITEFDDLPDFESMITSYKTVRLDNVSEQSEAEDVEASVEDDSVVNTAEDEEVVPSIGSVVDEAVDEIEESFFDDSFEPFDEIDTPFEDEVSAEDTVGAEADDESVAFGETEKTEAVEAETVVEEANEPDDLFDSFAFEDLNEDLPVTDEATADNVVESAIDADAVESDDEFRFDDDDEWESFGDFEETADENVRMPQQEAVATPVADEYVAPIHEDYVQEDAVFTDYDESVRMFEDISDAPVENASAAADESFESGFEIDFSVFEDTPKVRPETQPVVAETKPEKGGFFRRIKKK